MSDRIKDRLSDAERVNRELRKEIADLTVRYDFLALSVATLFERTDPKPETALKLITNDVARGAA